MNQIPMRVTEEKFEEHFSPYLSKAKRGFTSKIPRYKIFNYRPSEKESEKRITPPGCLNGILWVEAKSIQTRADQAN